MKLIAAALLAALFMAQPTVCMAEPAHITGRELLLPSSAPAPDEYMDTLVSLLDEAGIAWRRLSADDPFVLIVNSSIYLELTQEGGHISSVSLTAQGDGSALSGEVIAMVLRLSTCAYAPVSEHMLDDKLLALISSTSGADSVPGLDIALTMSPHALDVTLTPRAAAITPPPSPVAPVEVDGMDGLIALCAGLLPDGWTQTSHMSGDPDAPDLLLSIYAASTDPDALWTCARDVLGQYWFSVRRHGIACGRLSLALYSNDMTPLLSLGISRTDAIGCKAIVPDIDVDILIAELERLTAVSDALLIKHYE